MIWTVTVLAALGSGLIAGLFFAFSVSVMFGLVFFGTAIASLFLGGFALFRWHERASAYLLAGALLYVVGSFGVTLVFNVPRNNALARLDAAAGDVGGRWSRYVAEWTAWNHVRLIASLLASGSFTIAYALF